MLRKARDAGERVLRGEIARVDTDHSKELSRTETRVSTKHMAIEDRGACSP